VGGGHGVEHRPALGAVIDPIEHEAMQMDVEIIPGYPCPSPRWGQPSAVQNRSRRFGGGRAETLDDHFARSKMGRTTYARRGRAKDGTHQRDGAGVGFGPLESGLLDQNRNYRDVMRL